MIDARLSLALDQGGLELPSRGRLGVFNPPVGAALPGLPKDRAQIIADLKPDVDQWRHRGYDCVVEPQQLYGLSIVSLPRAKTAARALVAEAASRTDGTVVINGQKTDGIDSLLRDVRKRTDVAGPINKGHGKLFWVAAGDQNPFEDWASGPALTDGGFWTAPGLFSADGIDPASALLAASLPETLGHRVADLGAGWGFLSAHVLTRSDVEELHLVEAGHMALECAKHNVTDPRARFHWADATDWRPSDHVDAVVMNPPFHVGRAAEPTVGQAFIQAAAKMLTSQGQLWMVANRHLPYEATLNAFFAKTTELAGDRLFKLFHASRPRRTPA
ncbi:methyltransferase [uncultured Roseobacter sp.]|uniref:class I SAM-dependent methyltransferase n=1 Tax=uncultured Roseobacter sp. TaxID=114847 RepID=UPI002610DF95|nr:methyltransferase [uncultured Roseobacter sp.]